MTEALTREENGAVVPADVSALAIQSALAGDLSKLLPEERLKFYGALCHSEGLNPLTKPFDWISFQGKLVLYANKSCAEQKRAIHGVSLEIIERKFEFGCHIVRVRGKTKDGRTDEALAAVAIDDNARGDAAAIAMMKCETKAKRRVTFSLCGLSKFIVQDQEELDRNKTDLGSVTVETSQDRAALLNSSVAAIEVEMVKPETLAADGVSTAKEGPSIHKLPGETKTHAVSGDLPKVVAGEPEKSGLKAPAEQPTQTKPAPEAAPKSSVPAGFAGADGCLSDEVVANIETVLSEKTPEYTKTALRFLVANGKVKRDEDNQVRLSKLNHQAANFILKKPVRFHQMVEEWAKANPKLAAGQ